MADRNEPQWPNSLNQLLSGPYPDTKKRTRKQLIDEVTLWRAISSYLSDDVRYYLSHIGDTCRVVRRDYKGFLGDFIGAKFNIESVDVGVWERAFDPSDSKYYWERKTMRFTQGAMMNLEFIVERKEAESEKEDDLGEMIFKAIDEAPAKI